MKNKTSVLFVIGTRPEAIKLFPVIIEFLKDENLDVIVISTGQQKEMLDQTLNSLKLIIHRDLNVMVHNQSLASLSSRLFIELDDVFKSLKPDFLFIHGDTTTSMIAGIIGKYQKIPVFHVEAGLRSNDLYSPWPEEMNRKINAVTADYHITPTSQTLQNLLKEGIDEERIFVTGNTGIDTLRFVLNQLPNNNPFDKIKTFNNIEEKNIVLVTIHRRENFDKLESIFNAIIDLAISYPSYAFVYPVHLNPNVNRVAKESLSNTKNIYLLEPLDYLVFMSALDQSKFVITDSGGIQEESTYLGKPVILCRDSTERPEGLETNNIILCGTNTNLIYEYSAKLINSSDFYSLHSKPSKIFGDGNASKIIYDIFSVIHSGSK